MTPPTPPTTPDIVQRLAPSDEQRPAIEARGHDVAVVAGAGSGKTRTLVARYLSLLQEGTDLRRIVAITFTDKAAREMRSRVRHEVAAYAASGLDPETQAIWQSHYARLDSARISTIHSLCGDILRAHPVEANLDPLFEVLPESEQSGLAARAVQDALEWATSREDMIPLLRAYQVETLRDLVERALNKRLDVSESYARVPDDPWPLWSAAAMIWFRERLSDPFPVEAFETLVGFETDGAIDNAERAGDKLAAPMRQLLATWRDIQEALARDDWMPLATLLPTLRRTMYSGGRAGSWPSPSPKESLKALRSWYDETFSILPMTTKNPIDPALDRRMAELAPAFREMYARALARYTEAKDDRNALDFDDLEARAVALLADPAHGLVLRRWQRNVSAVLVDEFQDTNARQRELVTLLSSGENAENTSRGALFVVGDGKQSIYRFRGADVRVFREERAAIEARGGACHTLATSYRAHPALLQGINRLMSGILSGEDDPARPYVEPFAPLHPYRTRSAEGLAPPYIECHLTIGSKGEENALGLAAAALAERLVQLVEKSDIVIEDGETGRALNYGDVAILCRASSAFGAYENALDCAGIPYVTVAGRGFYDRPEIRDLLGILQALADPGDDLALAGALRSPAFGVSDMALYALTVLQRHDASRRATPLLWEILGDVANGNSAFSVDVTGDDPARCARAHRVLGALRELVGRAHISHLLKRLLDSTHYRAILLASDQARAVRNVDKLLVDAYASPHVGIGEFLETIRRLRDVAAREGEARAPGEGSVQIMSIHAAKGLEFPVVVLGDAAGGLRGGSPPMVLDDELGPVLELKTEGARSLIHTLATEREQDQEEEESRRLLYVALTRAREMLIINGNLGKPNKDGFFGAQSGWLKWLASEQVLDIEGTESPWSSDNLIVESESVRRDLALDDGTAVSCTFYPLSYKPGVVSSALVNREKTAPSQVASGIPALVTPIESETVTTGEEADEEPSATERRVQRVTQREGRYPPWLLGQMIHESLARWRFPMDQRHPAEERAGLSNDTAYDLWARSRLRDMGLIDEEATERLLDRARRLLRRFMRHPLYQHLDNARRLHEVPYETMKGDEVVHRRIDLLAEDEQGWCVYEFKSNHVQDGVSLEAFLADSPYVEQARAYARAVESLVGTRPRTRLVLLDLHGHVHVEDVTLASG